MDGVLVVDKPQGMTSHDVVAFVRRRFGLKKVGHAGTLDPMATGLLVLLIGSTTKSFDRFSSSDKEYYAEMTLGATSDTGDAWGRVTASGVTDGIDERTIREVASMFVGAISQVPHPFSAVKHKGRKLYEFARKGIIVEVEPREVWINRIDIIRFSSNVVSFTVTCSKGTYIRQLSVDIGNKLGCGAHLSALRRIRSGRMHVSQAVTIEALKAMDLKSLESKVIDPWKSSTVSPR